MIRSLDGNRDMTALACCKHALAKTASPVCLECYRELLTVARRMRELLVRLDAHGPIIKLQDAWEIQPLLDVFDTLVGREGEK